MPGSLLLVGLLLVIGIVLSERREEAERDAIWRAVNELRWYSHEFKERDLDENGVADFWTADVAGLFRRLPPGLDLERRRAAFAMAGADAKPLSLRRDPPKPCHGYYIVAVTEDESGSPFSRDTDGSGRNLHHPDGFAFCLYPAEYGPKTRYTWIVNRGGRFRRDNGGKPVLRWPSDDEMKLNWGRC